MSVNAGFGLGCILLAIFMRHALLRTNRRLEDGTNVQDVMHGEARQHIQGISEEENFARRGGFRYIT